MIKFLPGDATKFRSRNKKKKEKQKEKKEPHQPPTVFGGPSELPETSHRHGEI